MPLYEFDCNPCEDLFSAHLKIDERNEPQVCPKCGSCQTVRRTVYPLKFNLVGDSWASKNNRIRGQMRRKNARLTGKTNEMKRDQPAVTLTPNVAGEEVSSWSDAKKLAGSLGKNTASYNNHIRKEKV